MRSRDADERPAAGRIARGGRESGAVNDAVTRGKLTGAGVGRQAARASVILSAPALHSPNSSPPGCDPGHYRAPGLCDRLTIAVVTIKERLHKLVDELSDGEADEALRYIAERRSDPIVAAFRDAPDDDEPVTIADEQALAEVHADRGVDVPRIPFAQIKRKHGST